MKLRSRFTLAILILLIALAVFADFFYIPHPRRDFTSPTEYLLVRRSDTVSDIAFNLRTLGAISSQSNFIFYTRLSGNASHLRAGRYAVKPSSSIAGIVRMMVRGEQSPFDVTIPEGLTVAQVADILESTIDLDLPRYKEIITDRSLLDSLQVDGDNLEGYLAPSTYNLFYEENPRRVVMKMISHFFESLPDSFEVKANHLGLTFNEAVTLASMIEKEAMLDSERPMIAAVYLNRLRKGMRLECDPTVIYAMGGLDRPLAHKDLDYQSPYNTYRNYGLPPGPIANPGRKSLEAAVNPADVRYLFFVARGDGSHVFSYTLQDHNNAIIRIRRQSAGRS